ncbi:MAG: GGDEF-domain containing protein [Frankiales bacterium]|nr:GGDEF-domain containing protein [Frankiales bacterium]
MRGTRLRQVWTGWTRRQRLAAVLRAVVGCAVLVAALDVVLLRGSGAAPTTALLVVALLVALAEYPLLHLRFGGNHISFVWSEAAVLLGLATCPGPALALVVAGSGAASHLLQGRAPTKVAFNASVGCLSVSAAAATLQLLHGRADGELTLASAAALVVATTTYALSNTVLTSTVVATAQGCPLREVVLASGSVTALMFAGNVALPLGALVLVQRTPAVLFAVPPVAAVLALTYRAYLRASQERDVWRQLEVASRELNRLEATEVATAALRRARELFRCDDVELRLDPRHSHGLRVCRLVGDVLQVAEQGREVPVALALEDEEDGGSVISTSLSAPLVSPSGRIGALRLLFRGAVTLSARERQVMSTYAHAVSTTLQNAFLHEDVREEAARHGHDATHDALTGLANRVLLQTETRAALGGSGTTALLLLDLDHFKEINDTLGHAAGDVQLREVATRLRSAVGDEGLVARLGGDEFAVLLPGLADPADAEPLAERLLQLLAAPVEFDGLRLSIEASLGVACHPQDASEEAELFRRADVAMYQAKGARASWLRYDAARDDSSVHRMALVSELRLALDRDEILVHLQPQVDLQTGAVVSAEALCRWQHPVRGLLPPSEFVGVVEQSGLARPFTLRVLERALEACAQWHAEGRPLRVAVNLAARSLLDRSLPDDVAVLLSRTGVPASALVLEITETTATSELEVVEEVLAALRRSGVELSVDDFGTGYSSLAFLQRTAVNELKVDRSFVKGMLVNANDAALVRATIQLAHSLGARAVAEGVEHEEHAEALRDLGCDVAQGWLYGRPVPAQDLQTGHAPVLITVPRPRLVRLQA